MELVSVVSIVNEALLIQIIMANKILGLDLGTNSIGWAVVDNVENKIVDTGVRIFPEGVEAKTIGQGDKEQSRNATRREKRQMRRQFYRKKLRRIKLLEVLIEQGMCPLTVKELSKWKNWDKSKKNEGKEFPNSENFVNWLKQNPYELRARALKEEVTLEELGRILYHIIHRRGFLSSRKGNDDPKTIFEKGKPDENILPVNVTKEKIKDSSLGFYLNSISYKENVPYKTVVDENGAEIRIRGRYTTRDMYITEFEKIWQCQSQHHNIDKRKVKIKKVRELRGNINSKRNAKRKANLKEKYGFANVKVGETSDKGVTKVETIFEKPFKEFLAGNIEEVNNENGEKVYRFKSNDSVLFWQRSLRSQKGLLSNCRFEDNLPVLKNDGGFLRNSKGGVQYRSKKPCPLSHTEFELFRSYQFLNNIKYGKSHALSDEQKVVVLNLINKNDKNFDFVKIPQALKLEYEKFNYEGKLKVAGNPTIKQLKPLFSDEVWEKCNEGIWHCFYFFDDNERLYEKLKRDFGFKKSLDVVKKIKLKEGYSNVSLKAIRNILPFLKKGYSYDKAVVMGGVKNAFGNMWERFSDSHNEIERNIKDILKQDNKEGEAIEKIKEYLSTKAHFFGFEKDDPRFSQLYHHSQEIEMQDELDEWIPQVENLRNPIVQQGLNETRRLVNSLLRKYRGIYGEDFYFNQIKVEMGRDLRNNKKQRQDASIKNRENEHKNNEARERLKEYGLQASRTNIQKYLLFKEIEDRAGKCVCPYTGIIISIKQLFGSDNAIQIEHIIPRSISLDDGFGNKTICEAKFNGLKSEKTPYCFYNENPDPKLWKANSWDEISERAFRLLPYPKAKRFTSKKEFEKEGFIERQLNDSRYIAREAVQLLSHICKDVRVMPGQLTAELRHLWGLNNVLQPNRNIIGQQFNIDEVKPAPYFLVTDKNDEVVSVQPKLNEKPEANENQIMLPGRITKNKYSSKYYKFEVSDTELKDGNYWAKLNVGSGIRLIPKFTKKPETDEHSIVFRGKVEKGTFKNDTTGNISKLLVEEGVYWAKFSIIGSSFKLPLKGEQPKTGRNQLLLYGNVYKGEFKSYVYHCKTNLEDGKYWVILDVDKTNVEFVKAINPTPEINASELLITATVDDEGILSADEDNRFQKQVDAETGKYYVVLEIENKEPELLPIENAPPELEKGQKVIEGNIWVDKYTGEIKFDPKKNRDDHRHHAVDAIVIAFTEQGYLQRLSTYNAQRKDKDRRKLDSTEHYPEPWLGFSKDVQKSINSILISHKKDDRTLTKNKQGYSVRGQLHKENVFGKRQAPNQESGYHRRTKMTELKNNKHIDKVVDEKIKSLILAHLRDNCEVDTEDPKGFDIPKDAFMKDGKWRLFLPNKKGDPVPIKKIRIKEYFGNAVKLKSNINQHVNPRNNHHVLIYLDYEGNLQEDVVQFWTVVERQMQNAPVYQLPENGKEIVTSLEINDMFLLGLTNEEYESVKGNAEILSKYLFRVQKVSSSYYTFRSHLASILTNVEQELSIRSFGAWVDINPIKVEVNQLGEIVKKY